MFGSAHSLLFRADLVRSHDPFFNESNIHADSEVCFELLKTCDFGFVHQILTFSRIRPGSLTAQSAEVNTLIAGKLCDLITFGRYYLAVEEYKACCDEALREYYRFFVSCIFHGRRERRFWRYHKEKLTGMGVGLSYSRLARAVLARLIEAGLNPGKYHRKYFPTHANQETSVFDMEPLSRRQ